MRFKRPICLTLTLLLDLMYRMQTPEEDRNPKDIRLTHQQGTSAHQKHHDSIHPTRGGAIIKATNMILVGSEHKAHRAYIGIIQPREEEQQWKKTDIRHGMEEIGMILTNSPRLLRRYMFVQVPDLKGKNKEGDDCVQQSQASHTTDIAAADQLTDTDQHIRDDIKSRGGGDFGIPCSKSAVTVGLRLTDVEYLVEIGIWDNFVDVEEPCCIKKRYEHEKQHDPDCGHCRRGRMEGGHDGEGQHGSG